MGPPQVTLLRVAVALAITSFAGGAVAHPIHEIVQNAYLTLAPGTISLELELTAGPQVAARVVRALDANSDHHITPAEANAYASAVLAKSRLTIEGKPIPLRLVSIEVPPYAALLGAHGSIRIHAAAVRADHPGTSSLVYRNSYSPAESRCDANIFLANGAKVNYRVDQQMRSQDGRNLAVRFTLLTKS